MRPFLLVLALVALPACTPRPLVQNAPEETRPAGYPEHTARQIVAEVQAGVAPVQAVAADGRVVIASPSMTQDATYSLRARLADSLGVTVRGPLGVVAARAVATPDSFFAADRLHRTLYRGRVEAADRFVPGAGSAEQIARAALGLLVPDPAVAWTVRPDSGRYTLTGTVASGHRRVLVVDPALWRVLALREYDASGQRVVSQTADAFDTVDGVVLPRRVVLEGGGSRVELEHRRLAVNPPDLPIGFPRPVGYDVVEIE